MVPYVYVVKRQEGARNNRIFHYDLQGAQDSARALSVDVESFKRLCKAPLPADVGFTMDDDTNFAEWAEALLEWSPELRRLRYRLVPRHLTEELFWSRYFNGLREQIQALIFQAAGRP